MRMILLTMALFILVFVPAAQAQTRYLVSLPDIPLMPQMAELKDSRVVFDKAEGRIIQETVKAPNLTSQQVLTFYNQTLPALGWTPILATKSLARFSRNGEQLVVNLEKLESEALVGFAVSPKQP